MRARGLIAMLVIALWMGGSCAAVASPWQTLPSGAVLTLSGWDDEDDTQEYRVVMNDEEQYSIWQSNRDVPLGWRDAGFTGSKQACLDYIETIWTDMRPQSLRQKMEEEQANEGDHPDG